MIIAFVSIAFFSQIGSPLVMVAADRVPVINVEKTCKDSATADKEGNIDLGQPVADCMRDENDAKQQVNAVWSTYPAPIRERCTQEATLLGEGSYVDLLTCMQMSDPAKLTPTMDLKGASKNRNKN
jgi:hypothetical protein